MQKLGTYWSGFALTAVIALVALVLGNYIPLIGSSIFAIILGIIVSNTIGIPASAQAGVAYSGKKILQYAIIILGASMPIQEVSQTGFSSLRISVTTIVISFVVSYLIGRWLRLPRNLEVLIGFGTAICGGSAIAAASPILEAEDDEIALSMSTIFLFNIAAVFLFPILGHLMQMTDTAFGLWAGTAVNDTSSVVAAGYSYSQKAGDFATIVKLARALMIVPACLILAGVQFYHSKKNQQNFSFAKVFPWFILWFLVASLLTSLGVISKNFLPWAKLLSQFLMAMALAGIGCKVSFRQFKQAGFRPLITGAVTWAAVALSSLFLQYFVF
ncbi:YeiH family protein [Streptococcus dentasini]